MDKINKMDKVMEYMIENKIQYERKRYFYIGFGAGLLVGTPIAFCMVLFLLWII